MPTLSFVSQLDNSSGSAASEQTNGLTQANRQQHRPKHLTCSHLRVKSQSSSSLWHHESGSHPSGTACQRQNLVPTLWAGLWDLRGIRKRVKERRPMNCKSGSRNEQRSRETAQRARNPAPINSKLWYLLPAKTDPRSAKWKDVQMGRHNCLYKLPWIILTFLCDRLIFKAFTFHLQPSVQMCKEPHYRRKIAQTATVSLTLSQSILFEFKLKAEVVFQQLLAMTEWEECRRWRLRTVSYMCISCGGMCEGTDGRDGEKIKKSTGYRREGGKLPAVVSFSGFWAWCEIMSGHWCEVFL